MMRDDEISTGRAWYTVSILTLAYLFSFIDRQILSLMVGPIQRDLQLSDTQFSLLHGLAFAVFYTFMGIPIARLADARSRRLLMATGVAIWSLATALCGMARSFAQLFLARVAVGVGEAALSPAAYSLLADLFPRERLGRAIGVYSSGVFMGIGLSFVVGGVLVAGLEAAGGLTVPLLGTLKSWQATFLIVGSPGLLVALLILTLREPSRPMVSRDASDTGQRAALLGWLRAHPGVYLAHFAGFAMLTLLFNAILAWAPEYFIRVHGIGRADIGLQLGIITAICGGLGIIAGGLFSDYLATRGDLAAPMRAALFAAILLTPVSLAALLIDNAALARWLFAPLLFLVSFPFGPAASALQLVTPAHIRAQISAVYLFVVNLTGIGFGPTAAALLTDYVYRDPAKLHWSMATITALGSVLAILILTLSLRPYAQLHRKLSAA
ncbi:MAG: MFS transporter [Gammaproteobacteria bacterium]|nr:MAG: MFS transporter [Gammaproteobacteria bacterium]